MELLIRSLFLGLVNLSFCHLYTHAVFKLLSNLAHSGARVDLTISSLLIRTDKAKRWYLSIFLPLVYLSVVPLSDFNCMRKKSSGCRTVCF